MTDLICRELELSHDLEEVWRAVVDPAWLSRWLADSVTLEPWPGGEATFDLDGATRHGWVEEVLAPTSASEAGRRFARLSFWWQPPSEPASRVSLHAEETAEGGTRLRVVETRPLEILDLIGVPFSGPGGSAAPDGGPVMLAA